MVYITHIFRGLRRDPAFTQNGYGSMPLRFRYRRGVFNVLLANIYSTTDIKVHHLATDTVTPQKYSKHATEYKVSFCQQQNYRRFGIGKGIRFRIPLIFCMRKKDPSSGLNLKSEPLPLRGNKFSVTVSKVFYYFLFGNKKFQTMLTL